MGLTAALEMQMDLAGVEEAFVGLLVLGNLELRWLGKSKSAHGP